MRTAHSVRTVRAAEAAAAEQLPDGALMQRAAAGLAAICARLLDGPYGARVAVLVGGGDNGGDALYAGAALAGRGAQVEAVLLRPDRTHPQALARLRQAGGTLSGDPVRTVARADLVLDGVLGIGGRPGLPAEAMSLLELARDVSAVVVAVDLPSGVAPDTGETPGRHGVADVTVTFGTHKVAHLVDPAAGACGVVELVDIGLGDRLGGGVVTSLEDTDVAGLLPRPGRDAHKYTRGVLGVVAGSEDYTGAAVLSVGAAVHGGAGMVRHVGGPEVTDQVRRAWPQVVTGPGRVQAWVVGPGLGRSDDAERSLRWTLAEAVDAGVPVLVDADGLWHLRHLDASATGSAAGLARLNRLVLTPHAGELATLLDVDRAAVEARRLEHARAAATRWDAVVLLKGSTTVVASPTGAVRANATGTPALATAGSGDVLAGLIGALLAAGLDPFDAAAVGAHVHGRAGALAARRTRYPSAVDVAAELPRALLGPTVP